jgi:ABC-type branched-subunit amino acid transport system substrate-binding protein
MQARCWATLCVTTLALAGLAVPAAAATPRATSGGTLLIGQMNTEASPASPGTKITYGRDTLTAWAKMVNAAGGINGMKVKIEALDDANYPAKAFSNVKNLIDDGVVAIVSPTATATSAVWMPIAAAANVPVIGGGCYSSTEGSDQNFFCVTTTAILYGLKAQLSNANQGGKVFGITYDSTNPWRLLPLRRSSLAQANMKWSTVGTTNTDPTTRLSASR